MNIPKLMFIVLCIATQATINAAQITIQNDPHRAGIVAHNICFKSASGKNCQPMPGPGTTATFTVPDDTYECIIEAVYEGSSSLLTWNCVPNKTYVINKRWNGRVWVYSNVTEK
jgi:hypothetical protein